LIFYSATPMTVFPRRALMTTTLSIKVRLLIWAIILVLCSAAQAQFEDRTIIDGVVQEQGTKLPAVPRLVRFASALADGTGRPIAGTVPVIFSIYAQQQDEKPLWTETQIVQVETSGAFSVLLGATTTGGLPLEQFQANQAQWLGFHSEGQMEQARVLLVSAPYALKAAESESLNGLPASAFVQWKDLAAAPMPSLLPASTPGKAAAAPSPNSVSATSTASATDVAGFVPKYLDATTFAQSSLFDAGGKVGLNTQAPVAVLHIIGDGTAELVQLETAADVNTGLSILNSTQSWELALRQDLQEALVVRNKTAGADVMQISPAGDVTVSGKMGVGTTTPQAQLDVAGDLKLSAAGSGIIFPDGSRQTTASKAAIEIGSSPDTVVERDSTGSIAVNSASLQGNLQVPVSGYIATSDAVDTNVGVIPKLFLSATGGPGGGVIPSLTFRSLNPSHIFAEVAFQDNTPSPGQDIWVLQQDFLLNHTEDLAIRRRGQQVMTFWPLSANGSDVLTTLSGTRFRFERSGPYPVEFRDDSFALPEGLWRMAISQNCWLLDKNLSPTGDFATHNPVLETCADGNLILGNGLRTSGPLTSSADFAVISKGNISLTSAPGRNIRFKPGTGAASLFNAPIGVGTIQKPAASLHVASGGNLQEAIFESSVVSNEGISIRNPAQNWALGVRADLGQEFEIRNITSGIDALEVSTSGAVTVGQGNLKAAKGIRVDTSVNADGSGLKHGRAAIEAVARGATASVELDWHTPFVDPNYTVNCNVVNAASGSATLHLHHIQTALVNKVVAVVINDDPINSQSGVLNCMAMHD
jgi:hypothetical protein